MHTITSIIAQYLIIVPILLSIVVWLKFSLNLKKEYVLLALIGAAIALGLAKIGAMVFNNPRPFVVGHFAPYFSHSNDNGFPSDHTLLSAFLSFIMFRNHKRLATILFLLALIIGMARVAAGVHHLIDILGSIIFAAIGAYSAYLITQKLFNKKGAISNDNA